MDLDSDELKRGTLFMRVGDKLEGGSWESYIFVLSKLGYLEFRPEQMKKGREGKAKGFQLERCTTVVREVPHENVFPFYVNTVEVDLYVAAATLEERDEWMAALKERAARADVRAFNCIMAGDAPPEDISRFLEAAAEVAQIDDDAAAKLGYGGVVDEAQFLATDQRTGEVVLIKFSHLNSQSFGFLRRTLYGLADFIMMNFSVTDKVSFQRMDKEYLPEFNENNLHRTPRVLIGFKRGDREKQVIAPSEGEWLADYVGCSYYFEIDTVSKEVFSSRSSTDSEDLETTIQDVFMTMVTECVKGSDKLRRRRYKKLMRKEEAEEVTPEPRLRAVKSRALLITAGIQSAVSKNVEKLKHSSRVFVKARLQRKLEHEAAKDAKDAKEGETGGSEVSAKLGGSLFLDMD